MTAKRHLTDVQQRSDGSWAWTCGSCASRGVWVSEAKIRGEAAEHTRHAGVEVRR